MSIVNDNDADALRGEAARCRRLASSVLDRRTLDALKAMASEYDSRAEEADRGRA